MSQAPALAQDLQSQARALAEIRRTAMMLCPTVDNTSQVTKAEAKAQVEATLPGLFKRLMDLGASASGSYANTASRGVVQNQLAALIASTNSCRLEVLKTLQDKMLSAPAPQIVAGKPISISSPVQSAPVVSAPATKPSSVRRNAPQRSATMVPVAISKTSPTLKVFFKNNLTSRDMVQLARLLPSWKVVPGGRNLVDPTAAADALFVNRDVVRRDDVLAALVAFSALGVPIKAVIPSYVGGRREIQVGTVVTDLVDGQENTLKDNGYISVSRLQRLQGNEFWRAAWNEAGYCGSKLNYAAACSLDKNARPVFEEERSAPVMN